MVRNTVVADCVKKKKLEEGDFVGHYWAIPAEKSTDDDYIPALAIIFAVDGELIVGMPTLLLNNMKATRDSEDSRVLNFSKFDFKIRLLEYIPCPPGYPNKLYSDHLKVGDSL